MDLDQKFVKLYEGWKKGKYKITDDKGNIIGTYNSGSKAQKVVDDLMQQGKYDKLTVEIIEDFEKEASSYIDRKKKEKEKKDYKKKHGRDKFAFVGKSMDRKHSMGIAAEFDPKVDEGIMDTAGFHNYPKRNKVGDEIEKIASKGGTDKFNLSKIASELQKGRIPHKFIKKLSPKGKEAVHDIMKDFGWKKLPEEVEENYDKNQLLRVQHDERLIAEAGDICSLDKADLRSKAMQKVYDKKCSPEMIKKKKSIFGKIAKGLDLYNGDKMQEATNLKQLKKQYDKNEDENKHTENYLMLAKAFGSKSEIKKVQDIMKRNEKQGHTSKSDMDWMYKNINPYYDKIRNEEHMKLEDTVKQVLETNKNDKSDDGEGLDAVQPKAVKKKFKDRKDKDIDNDGDTDDSDKFLHKKRKAISKAVAADKKEQKTYSKLYSHVKNLMSK